jgi:vitamin B12 transporter
MNLLLLLQTFALADQVTPIKVTAPTPDRTPKSIQRDTLTPETIKRNQYSTIESALTSFSSMTVVQPGNAGQPASIFMRGTNSNHMQVRLDGVRINSPDASNGTFDTGLITPDSVASISLLRGGQGSLYGPDAIGGVLLFSTPKATATQESILIEGGGNRVARLSGNASHVTPTTGFYLGANGVRSSGYTQTPTIYRQGNGHYPRLYYHHNGLVARLDHQVNEKASLMMASRYSEADSLIQLSNRASPQERVNLLQRLQLNLTPIANWSHQIGVGLFNSRQKNAIKDSLESKLQGQRAQLDWKQTYHSDWGDFSTTLEGAQDKAWQKDRSHALAFQQDALGVGGLWCKKFSWIDLDLSLRQDKVAGFTPATTHREGMVLKVTPTTNLKASYGTSFKTPTLYQLYAKTPYYKGNPNLKPEHSRQWEVTLDQLLTQHLRWEETFFTNQLSRLIYSTPDFSSNINLGKARIKGLESGVTWVDSRWQMKFSHTLMKSENRIDRTGLLRRPQTKLSTELAYTNEAWRTSLEIIRLGHRPDIHPTTFVRIKAKPYTLVHAKIQKSLDSGMRIFGRVENLLNRKIQEPVGYRKSGLAVYLGMEAKIA